MKVSDSPSVSVVICHYYLSSYALDAVVKDMLSNRFFKIKALVIVHNNSQLKCNFEYENVVHHIEGSNRLLDFSAYYEGLSFLKDNNLDDNALFINDTLFTKLPSKYILRRLSNTIDFSQQVDVPCVVGFHANYNFFLQKNPWSGHINHFCAAVFYANKLASDKLITSVEHLSNSIQNVTNLDDNAIERITGKQFYNYLKLVLFNRDSVWKPEYLSGDLSALKIRKALCFYLEHYFSALIQQSDGGIIYINNGKHHLNFLVRVYISLMLWKVRMFLRSKISK